MQCTLVTDGGCSNNPGFMRIGVLITENNKIVKKLHRKLTRGTNNQAEVLALIEGLHQVKELGYTCVKAYTDSELMCNHFNGAYRINNPKLKELHNILKNLVKDLDTFTLEWHRRTTPLAVAADALSNNKLDIEQIVV